MSYNLFLDDLRNLEDVTYLALPPVDWHIVRSYGEFCSCIKRLGIPNRVSFDHDISAEHYPQGTNSVSDIVPYETYAEPTGLACAQFLIDTCKAANQPIPVCYVHSFNQAGRKNIMDALISAGAKQVITYYSTII